MEPRRRARAFVLGLVAELPRKNCRVIAGHAGDRSPDGMQHLLARAKWDTDGVRDDVRGNVVRQLTEAGVLSQVTVGKRNRAFEAKEVINAFTDLERQSASRAGRPAQPRTEQVGTAPPTAKLIKEHLLTLNKDLSS